MLTSSWRHLNLHLLHLPPFFVACCRSFATNVCMSASWCPMNFDAVSNSLATYRTSTPASHEGTLALQVCSESNRASAHALRNVGFSGTAPNQGSANESIWLEAGMTQL